MGRGGGSRGGGVFRAWPHTARSGRPERRGDAGRNGRGAAVGGIGGDNRAARARADPADARADLRAVASRLHAPPRRDRAAGLVGDSVNLVRDRRDRRRVGVAYASRGCALRRGRSSRLLGHGGALRRRAPFCPAHVKGSAVPLTIELITRTRNTGYLYL